MNKPDFIKEIVTHTIDKDNIPVGSLVTVTFANDNDIMNAMNMSIDVIETIKDSCFMEGEIVTVSGMVICYIGDCTIQVFVCIGTARCYSEIPINLILENKVKINVLWKPEAKDTELFYGHKRGDNE